MQIRKIAESHVNSGDHRSLVAHSDDYEGEIRGNRFRVQIRATEPPHWYECDGLDEDDKADVLNAIETSKN